MAIRYLKMVLLVLVALLALTYAGQNLANLDAAMQAVAYVMRMDDHAVYPDSIGIAVDSPALTVAALATIIADELAAGVLAAKGSWNLWRARRSPAAEFQAAQTIGLPGCGLGLSSGWACSRSWGARICRCGKRLRVRRRSGGVPLPEHVRLRAAVRQHGGRLSSPCPWPPGRRVVAARSRHRLARTLPTPRPTTSAVRATGV